MRFSEKIEKSFKDFSQKDKLSDFLYIKLNKDIKFKMISEQKVLYVEFFKLKKNEIGWL